MSSINLRGHNRDEFYEDRSVQDLPVVVHVSAVSDPTCLCGEGERVFARLVASRAQVQVDGKLLASSHDQALHSIELSVVLSVIEGACQVPAAKVQIRWGIMTNRHLDHHHHHFK